MLKIGLIVIALISISYAQDLQELSSTLKAVQLSTTASPEVIPQRHSVVEIMGDSSNETPVPLDLTTTPCPYYPEYIELPRDTVWSGDSSAYGAWKAHVLKFHRKYSKAILQWNVQIGMSRHEIAHAIGRYHTSRSYSTAEGNGAYWIYDNIILKIAPNDQLVQLIRR